VNRRYLFRILKTIQNNKKGGRLVELHLTDMGRRRMIGAVTIQGGERSFTQTRPKRKPKNQTLKLFQGAGPWLAT
jgi:hypothetical protein